MEDVDRPPDVQALAEPAWRRRPRVQAEAERLVIRAQSLYGVAGHLGTRGDVGQ
jgi:hypothetical protein